MTRERWMLGGVGLLVFLLVAVGTVLIVSGDGDTTVGVSATTTSSTTTTTRESSPTTSTSSTPSTPSVTVGAICTTPEEASMALVDGWLAGDQAAAARCAVPAAVTTIFQTSGTGAVYTFQGCLGDDPGLPDCAYTYEGGSMHLALTGTEPTGWRVQSVSYVAD